MTTLHRLGPDDWPRWRDLRQRSLREEPDAFVAAAHQWLDRWDHELLWRERLAALHSVVAEVDGEDVGTAGLDQTTGELVSMWVAREHRGRGLGRALVEAILTQTEGPVTLRVMARNRGGVIFYEGCGFAVVSAEVDDEGCLTMARSGQSRGAR